VSRLIFAYAVDGGPVSSIVNYMHKMVSPGTYRCNMCALTYGTFGTKQEWTTFIESLPYEVILLHRDELAERYPGVKDPLPAVFAERGGALSVIVDAPAMTRPRTLDDLIATIRTQVAAIAHDSSPSAAAAPQGRSQ
jgi:hypothetical protein